MVPAMFMLNFSPLSYEIIVLIGAFICNFRVKMRGKLCSKRLVVPLSVVRFQSESLFKILIELSKCYVFYVENFAIKSAVI